MLNDLKFGFRQLLKHPAVSLVVNQGLILVIGLVAFPQYQRSHALTLQA